MADTPTFQIEDLRVSIDGKEILKGVNLEVNKGEVHALMGPNGSGKSTLANALMGHPRYTVTSGRIIYQGEDITTLPVDLRAKKGMFLAFQYPLEIPGVKVRQFLRMALKSVSGTDVKVSEFRKLLTEKMKQLEVNPAFAERYLNEGFSGGEKKRNEVLQMAILQPELAIMDETDSGLDIDALKIVSDGINALRGPDLGILLITHYQRMLNYVTPDFVHVLVDGRVVRSGGKELALELEAHGYDQFQEKVLEAVS
ncbi:MAG TPA: Fe-S cluster assembly ATPase SufC [Dehalococcoidia bacterium]|nr:Fe-S cluster assembly ATPase SufC [Dehalococcoidia bacterium]